MSSTVPADVETLVQQAAAAGLAWRGAFHVTPGEIEAPGATGQETLILLGFAGRDGFGAFEASPEHADGAPHPLDRWSSRVIGGLARTWGGLALFPFGGPPFHPFQRWAMRAGPVFPSPLGLLIHPRWGLWHSYRGAILLPERLALRPDEDKAVSPCETCMGRPCLSACPVGAFSPSGYDVGGCAAHLRAPEGAPCMAGGCLARRACPVGHEEGYDPGLAAYTMAAFLRAR